MLDTSKPHKGKIKDWWKKKVETWDGDYPANLGYIIFGRAINHPQFGTTGLLQGFHTSLVVKREGNEIETLNSRYTLVPDDEPAPEVHIDVV